MKYLKIQNDGELDIRLVALMGGTTKSNNEFKIGQFGTGLKYTIAYLVRNNVDFKIFCGEKEARITVETENIKDEDFNIICIDGNRTSITDRMGLEWEAWMIIRELWCNALDEGGADKSEVIDNLTGTANKTTFYIQISNEIKKVLDNWGKYFLHDKEPLFSSETCAIYNGGENLRIYKQGVLIKEIEGEKCLYNYDLKTAQINELRQFMGSVNHCVFKCLQNATSIIIEHFLSSVKDDHYEGSKCDYNWFESFGKSWKETIGNAKLIHEEAVKNIESRGINIDVSDKIIVPKKVYEALTNQIEGISALRTSSKMNEFYESYNSELDEKLKQGLVILESAGYNFSPKIKFVFGVFGDKNIGAQINHDTAECFVSENMLNKSLFNICGMLIEENEHFKTGLTDCSRSFQQHFIDMYCKQLLKNSQIEL